MRRGMRRLRITSGEEVSRHKDSESYTYLLPSFSNVNLF
jgi:hypothetical protein